MSSIVDISKVMEKVNSISGADKNPPIHAGGTQNKFTKEITFNEGKVQVRS
jgi:hypothetical protein